MNIGIDIRCLMEKNLTGVGEYTFNLLKHLFEIDNKNQYYLFYNSRKKVQVPRFNHENVYYCKFNWPNKLLNLCLVLFKWPKIDKMIEKRNKKRNKEIKKIDLIFFPNISFFSTNCPYIITAHDLSFHFFPEFLSWKRKLWHFIINPKSKFNNAEKIIAVSRHTANDLQNHLSNSQNISTVLSGIKHNYQPVDANDSRLQKIKQKYNLPDKFIMFLGTLEPRKNLQTSISAFNKIEQDIFLVIAGTKGWKCKKILKQIATNPKIKHIGFVPEEDKVYLYNLARFFVYPSYYEGFGFPPLEATACACPVITSNNSSLTEICADAALYIDPHNINDLKNAMQQMLNQEIATIYKQKGLEQSKKFSWQKAAEEFLHHVNISIEKT